jgi:hypothetical protein
VNSKQGSAIKDRPSLTHAHVGVSNARIGRSSAMQELQRVNLLLERRQREALEKLAQQKNRSVSDLVREYITAGLREDNSQQRERQLALENARALKARVLDERLYNRCRKDFKLRWVHWVGEL